MDIEHFEIQCSFYTLALDAASHAFLLSENKIYLYFTLRKCDSYHIQPLHLRNIGLPIYIC